MPYKDVVKQLEAQRRSYRRNKEKRQKEMKQRRLDIRQQMRQYKSKIGCHLCGETHFACLDFHHKNPGEKEYKVSTLVHDGHSWDSIMQEVEKCVLLCANCHRKIHVKEV